MIDFFGTFGDVGEYYDDIRMVISARIAEAIKTVIQRGHYDRYTPSYMHSGQAEVKLLRLVALLTSPDDFWPDAEEAYIIVKVVNDDNVIGKTPLPGDLREALLEKIGEEGVAYYEDMVQVVEYIVPDLNHKLLDDYHPLEIALMPEESMFDVYLPIEYVGIKEVLKKEAEKYRTENKVYT